jgi:EpsI family protein
MHLHGLLQRYKLTLLALTTIATVAIVYSQSFSRIVEMWSISYYEFGWLVYPIAIYVLVEKRRILARTQWSTSLRGALLVVTLVLVWVAAHAAGVQVVEFVSASSLVFALFWAIAGTEAMRMAAFPLLLLIAAVPMGEFLVEPLMRITAEISSALLALTGVPTIRDGQFFYLPGGSFEVADVCSGFKYLLATVLLSLGYSYVTYSSNKKRLVFIAVAAVAVVITNGVRAFIVMSIASATEMKVLGGYDHVVFGMLMFAMAFLALIWFGNKYADLEAEDGMPSVSPHKVRGAIVHAGLVAVTIAVVLTGPVLAKAIQSLPAVAIADLPPPDLRNCGESDALAVEGFPTFAGADYERRTYFACGDFLVRLYVASYSEQEQGKELISWANRVWPSEWWRYVEQTTVSLEIEAGPVNVQQVAVSHPAGQRLVWYWYQVGLSVSSNPVGVKTLETLQLLALKPVESSVVVIEVTSDRDSDVAELRKELERHASQVMRWNSERVALGAAQ